MMTFYAAQITQLKSNNYFKIT